MKRGKKYVEAAKAVDRATLYDTAEAISLVKKAAVAKFDETIEAHIRTGCDGRHADQQIRGAVVLPHGTGKKVRVLVFARDAKAEEAKAAGAEFVGAEDLIPKIQNEGWLDFDVVVATPDMMGVVVPRSRKSAVKTVLFQPLSMIEFEADYRPMSNLYRIKEAKSWYPFRTLPYDPYKSSIAMFLAEFLYRALREEAENGPLFAYLEHSIRWLDECDRSFSNFHLVFLMRFSRFLGLYPNTEDYREGCFFDMLNACFVSVRPLHGAFLKPEEASRINLLMRMNYETMHLFTMSRLERNRCLVIMNDYYRLHLPDFPV